MKTKEEILIEFGCPNVPFDENVTMYYPAILSAMEEYANAKVNEAMRKSCTENNIYDFNPDDYECLAGVCPDLSDEDHCETCTLKKLKHYEI